MACTLKAVMPCVSRASLQVSKLIPNQVRVAAPNSWWKCLSGDALTVSATAPKKFASHRCFAAASEEAIPEEATSEEDEVDPSKVKQRTLGKSVKHILNLLSQEAVETAKAERDIPRIRPGDVLAMKVEVPQNKRRLAVIKGIVIAMHNNGINSTFRIRRVLAGVGVEMVFHLYSPSIKEIKIIDRKRVRRAKLYYLRDKLPKFSTVK